jgi:hypothetical protein
VSLALPPAQPCRSTASGRPSEPRVSLRRQTNASFCAQGPRQPCLAQSQAAAANPACQPGKTCGTRDHGTGAMRACPPSPPTNEPPNCNVPYIFPPLPLCQSAKRVSSLLAAARLPRGDSALVLDVPINSIPLADMLPLQLMFPACGTPLTRMSLPLCGWLAAGRLLLAPARWPPPPPCPCPQIFFGCLALSLVCLKPHSVQRVELPMPPIPAPCLLPFDSSSLPAADLL